MDPECSNQIGQYLKNATYRWVMRFCWIVIWNSQHELKQPMKQTKGGGAHHKSQQQAYFTNRRAKLAVCYIYAAHEVLNGCQIKDYFHGFA